MRKIFSAVLMTTALVAATGVPSSALAAQPRVYATARMRVYDPYRRDYHRWDERERRAYRAYLAERRLSYLDYQRQNRAHRRAYWRWRHEHDRRF